MARLEGKVALITGASRGLGAGIALRFAEEGADICVNYLSGHDEATAVAKQVEALGRRAVCVRADVAEEVDAKRLVDVALDAFGQVDILVNNAGIKSEHLVVDLPVEEWDRIVRVDLRSVFLVSKFALPGMIERRYGKIVNVSSLVASTGRAGFAHYCAAKAGIVGFSKALAQEVGRHNVNVNCIAPGAVEADIEGSTEEWRQSVIQKAAMRRFGQVADIANTALFLAADESKHLTGQTFHVSGGSYFP